MAFTVRKLSIKAEQQLKDLIENDRCISTKTQAIEKVLEEHYRVSELYDSNKEKRNLIRELKYELREIKDALNIIHQFRKGE